MRQAVSDFHMLLMNT